MVKRSKEKLEQMEIFDRRSVDIVMILFTPIGLTIPIFLVFFSNYSVNWSEGTEQNLVLNQNLAQCNRRKSIVSKTVLFRAIYHF